MARSGSGGHCTRSNTSFLNANVLSAYSYHAMVKGSAAPGVSTFHDVMGIRQNTSGGSNPDIGLRWDTGGATAKTALHRESGSTYRNAQIVTAMIGGVWYPMCHTWDGTTSRVYLNGALEASIAAAAPQTQDIYVNQLAQQVDGTFGISAQWPGGEIGDVACWKVALSADEITSLALGFSPRLIRPDKRWYWAENIANNVEHHQGALTNLGSTPVFSDHPRRFG
jgi:hypothetical protein